MNYKSVMGTIYYGVCDDCRQYIDLDKFYSWAPPTYASIWTEDLSTYDEYFVVRALRLNYFIKEHNGHRVSVRTEHEVEFFSEDHPMYEQVYPWPSPQEPDEAMLPPGS